MKIRNIIISASLSLTIALSGTAIASAEPLYSPDTRQIQSVVSNINIAPSAQIEVQHAQNRDYAKDSGQNILKKTSDSKYEEKSVGSWAIKAALKQVSRNRKFIINNAKTWLSKSQAKRVENAMYEIDPVIKDLLKYDHLVWGTVQDKLPPVVGRDVAYWIVQAIQIVFPI